MALMNPPAITYDSELATATEAVLKTIHQQAPPDRARHAKPILVIR
jgi:hypothetical protein